MTEISEDLQPEAQACRTENNRTWGSKWVSNPDKSKAVRSLVWEARSKIHEKEAKEPGALHKLSDIIPYDNPAVVVTGPGQISDLLN